jgi:Fur family transcriptional regulator, ferric uptake regulator
MQIICNKRSRAVQDTLKRAHSQGKRMTAQRRLILETLQSIQGHPTAEEVYKLVKPHAPRLHLSTVYRTMRWLEEEGLVGSLWLEGDRRQERFDTSFPSQHHHFVCSRCKELIEFDSQDLTRIQNQFEQEHGAEVESASLVFYGLCRRCLAAGPGLESQPATP